MYPKRLNESNSYVPRTQQWLRSLVFFKDESEARIMAAKYTFQLMPTRL